MDELRTPGADSALSKSREAHYLKAASIEDPGFKAAQESVWHLKRKLKKPNKPKAGEEPPPPERAPADPKGWELGGLPVDPESKAYMRRHKHPGGSKLSL
ncbi:unnamed protein product [Scytosiphon promiscuus]